MTIDLHPFNSDVLPAQLLEMAQQEKWFKIFVSKKFNGLESSLPEGLQIIRKTNQIMGSFGWCINLGAGANYFSGFYNLAGAKKVFSKANTVLAGSGGLAEKITPTKGGYLVTGNWGKATGTDHATHFTCNAVLPTGETVSLTLNRSDVSIEKNWDLFAMKASSSYSFSTTEAFVSEDLIFKIGQPQPDSSYAIHALPFDCFAAFSMTASVIGLAEGILEKLQHETLKDAADQSVIILQKCIDSRLKIMTTLAMQTWELLCSENINLPIEAINQMVKETGQELFDCVSQLYFDTGLLMADERKPAHHQYKDFMLAIQHSIFK